LLTLSFVPVCRNNHLRQHRESLRAAVAGRNPPVRLLALNWSLEGLAPAEVHAICGTRITARGANHQSLRPAASREHEQVIWMFINKTEGLAPAEVDEVVDMSMADGLAESVERAVEGVVRVLGLPAPGAEKVREGVERARAYAVAGAAEGSNDNGAKDKGKGKGKAQEKKPAAQEEKKKKTKGPRYYGLLPEVALESLLAGPVAQEPTGAALYAHLVKEKRVAVRPHVTLVHSKGLEEAGAQDLWARCAALDTLDAKAADAAVFTCTLGSVVWNERVMALTVDDVRLETESTKGQAGAEFVSTLSEEVRKRLHITVGTRNASIAAVEGKALVESWRAGKTAGIKSLSLGGVTAKARVQGLFS
jgi:tRNA ligase